MPINFNLSEFNYNNIFIETGTYIGEGVKKAISSGFTKIISIELDKKRYEICKNKFENNDNVEIILGDSGKVLPNILKNINQPCTFFLDAHYCVDNAEISEKWCPLNEELDAIRNHHIKNHTILVDDIRCMDNSGLMVNNINDYFKINEIKIKEVIHKFNDIYLKTKEQFMNLIDINTDYTLEIINPDTGIRYIKINNNYNINYNDLIEIGFIGKNNLLNKINEINSNYIISYIDGCEKNDVLVAR